LKAKKYSTLKNDLAYYNAGVVAVNLKVVGLAPGVALPVAKIFFIFGIKVSQQLCFNFKAQNHTFLQIYF
jgi:hypothetical protein